jgi:hypothetical protein
MADPKTYNDWKENPTPQVLAARQGVRGINNLPFLFSGYQDVAPDALAKLDQVPQSLGQAPTGGAPGQYVLNPMTGMYEPPSASNTPTPSGGPMRAPTAKDIIFGLYDKYKADEAARAEAAKNPQPQNPVIAGQYVFNPQTGQYEPPGAGSQPPPFFMGAN